MHALKNILALAATASVFTTSAQAATPPAPAATKPALEYIGLCTQANALNRSEYLTRWRMSENQQETAPLNANVLQGITLSMANLAEIMKSKKDAKTASFFNTQATEYARALVELRTIQEPAQAAKRLTVPACKGQSI